ncbi:hypothetical protein [Clostridium prolinivorans]|uniref:hypothetical protein n=1 Tax=Clostridium prolinivorans TaxID=2769420 RepID=UPI000FDC1AA8|nr:hypothetical protein [Clostridium prolinivorans]
MYEALTVENANKIKQIILSTQLEKEIVIDKNKVNISLRTDRVSDNQIEENWGNNEFFLENESNKEVLTVNNKSYWVSIKVGWWRDTYRIKNAHITLGTNYYGFGRGHNFFSQLELSQALEDKNNIYIVKNISNLAGDGSISRLNSGLKDKDKKLQRRNELIKRINGQVISYKNLNWLIVSKFNKEYLYNEEKQCEIFYCFLKDFLEYSLTIEEIIAEEKLKKRDR